MNFPAKFSKEATEFGEDVIAGLSLPQKKLPCRWLYDRRGSELFEQITLLPEYYPTRTETGILKEHAPDIATMIGTDAVIVEYGAGAATKTRLLLDALSVPRAYIPIDISKDFLKDVEQDLRADYPDIDVHGIAGDFLDPALELNAPRHAGPTVGFFPGSTIGNMSDDEIVTFLTATHQTLGDNRAFLIGFDLKKDPDILIPAYDDAAGITAAFNLNIISRVNRELSGTFDLACFDHEARWNEEKSRIEMHLVSTTDQTAEVLGQPFRFRKDETIHTENSRKFDLDAFSTLVKTANWQVAHIWFDPKHYFAVALMTVKT